MNPSPEQKAWLWSSLTYSWLRGLFKITKNRQLEQEDLFDLPLGDSTQYNTDKFQAIWNEKLRNTPKEKRTNKVLEKHLKWSLWSIVRVPLLWSGVFRFVNSILQLSVPFVVAELLTYIEEIDDRNEYDGFVWALILGVIYILKAIIENRFFWVSFRGGWKARSTISSAVFNKSLRLSTSSRQSLSQGQIVNLMQLDAEKLERFAPVFHVFWDSFLQIGGYCTVIFFYIEESVFIGLGVLLLMIPLQAFLYVKLVGYTKKFAVFTDERVKLSNEALISILAVKSAGWETNFSDRIKDIRNKELKPLRDSLFVRSIILAVVISVPVFTAVGGLSYFGLTRGDGAVTAAILFASIQGFSSLRFPLFQIPTALTAYADAKVSQKRLARFFALEETGTDEFVIKDIQNKENKSESESGNKNVVVEMDADPIMVEIKNGEFFWSLGQKIDNFLMDTKKKKKKNKSNTEVSEPVETNAEPVAVLRDINFQIPKGALVGVVGTVGSGKTTLLNALLGELIQTKGTRAVNSTVAFAAQSAWIQNATLKDNILFGEEVDQERYKNVIEVCQLKTDLTILEDGDMTEIGERGINLSGGQAQRVSVARAAYSSSELVLLDDPLSALDPEVAKKLFDECIVGFLSDRTRVMVTNQLNFLKSCDYIIGLGHELADGEVVKDGVFTNVIRMQGTFTDLMENNKDFSELLSSFEGEEEEPEEGEVVEVFEEIKRKVTKSENRVLTKIADDGKALMQAEEREVGAVKWRNYWLYIKAGGICFSLLALLFLTLGQLSSLSNTFLLSFWANDPNYVEFELYEYLGFYGLSAVVTGILYFFQTYSFYYVGVRASRHFHTNLIDGIFRAPMSFFDTTPTGRIVARFSRDLFSLDTELPQNFIFLVFFGAMIISAVIAIATQLPLFLVLIPFLLVFYYYFMSVYRPIARDTKRLEAISRSPIYAHFGETLNGLSSIRAYGKVESFIKKCESNIDSNIKSSYVFKALERWIGVRLELLGAIVIAITSALIVFASSEGQISAGIAGVLLNLVLGFTGIISGTIRSFVTVETIFNSVERLDHYSNNIEREKPFISDSPPDENWPTKGKIVFNNVVMRYREETPIVLKGVTVTIPGGSTCGVVGRTGCGKSSLMLTLLRVVEAEGGSITIDGINIAEIGLHELRQKVSMVPQSPVMFSGTVRLNLDPFQRYNDDELWTVLEQVNLEEHVASLAGKLDSEVVEYGENFSQGQRQLMCMARSLLANAKVLLLDEATSSVDYETDAVIQATIRKQFVDCTILTIAHRVQTIADYDNVLVMDNGRVGEFGPPATLLEDPSSQFSKIVGEMGSGMEAKVRSSVLK